MEQHFSHGRGMRAGIWLALAISLIAGSFFLIEGLSTGDRLLYVGLVALGFLGSAAIAATPLLQFAARVTLTDDGLNAVTFAGRRHHTRWDDIDGIQEFAVYGLGGRLHVMRLRFESIAGSIMVTDAMKGGDDLLLHLRRRTSHVQRLDSFNVWERLIYGPRPVD